MTLAGAKAIRAWSSGSSLVDAPVTTVAKQHIIASARELAARVHAGEELGGQPLMTRLDEVRSHGDQHQAVAYLHYILDERLVNVDDLANVFGPLIADCVVLLFGNSANRPKCHQSIVYDKLAAIPTRAAPPLDSPSDKSHPDSPAETAPPPSPSAPPSSASLIGPP